MLNWLVDKIVARQTRPERSKKSYVGYFKCTINWTGDDPFKEDIVYHLYQDQYGERTHKVDYCGPDVKRHNQEVKWAGHVTRWIETGTVPTWFVRWNEEDKTWTHGETPEPPKKAEVLSLVVDNDDK
tara:strand:+ start:223 stop:603 length:381 start_codon:yes stop_codon:yes gene_type:complete